MCETVSKDQENTTAIFYLVAAFLSLIGSMITIVAFFRAHKKNKQLFFQFIFFLSITDFMASVFVIVSQLMTRFMPESYTSRHCVAFRAIVQYFLTASFMWTTVISIHLYRALHQKPEYRFLNTVYHACSWGIPFVLIMIVVGGKQIVPVPKANWCHLTQTYEWAVWFAPMLATVFLNLIFYILILKDFRQQEKIHGRIDMKKQLSLYLLAFVLCWIFDIVEHIVTLAKPGCELYWLWILQDFFSPLQGFLNFLVYGLSGRMLSYCISKDRSKRLPRTINYVNSNYSQETGRLLVDKSSINTSEEE